MSYFKFIPESIGEATKYLASKGELIPITDLKMSPNLEWIAIIETANKLKAQEDLSSDNNGSISTTN